MILELRQRLYDAVSLRMQGDVPIGAYLSGGLDSAVIAGMLADIVKKKDKSSAPSLPGVTAPFQCFSVGFEEGTEFDEMRKSAQTDMKDKALTQSMLAIAERTAKHLGVPFVAQRCDEATLADNFEAATVSFEHHNPDLNSVAKFVLSKLAADHGVKVVLSGTPIICSILSLPSVF